MCSHLFSVSHWLLPFSCNLSHTCSASDDLENPDKLRSLLKDLHEARQAKSREGLKQLEYSELSVRSLHLRCSFALLTECSSCLILVRWRSTSSDHILLNQ